VVLTPHPGEAAALLNLSVPEVEANRFLSAQAIADNYGVTVVLKGSRTIVAAPGKTPVVCSFGSPALGTAGSGDVLSGILGALLVGADSAELVFERTQLAVGLHALAGEIWSLEQGGRGLLASEIADKIPAILRDLEQSSKH
jgi:NAD(P)H-hydrate epimerase